MDSYLLTKTLMYSYLNKGIKWGSNKMILIRLLDAKRSVACMENQGEERYGDKGLGVRFVGPIPSFLQTTKGWLLESCLSLLCPNFGHGFFFSLCPRVGHNS